MYSWLSYWVCMVYTRELDWIQVSIQGKKNFFFHTLLCVKESWYYWIIKVYLIKEQLNLFVNKMNSNVDISKTFFVSKSRILSPNSRVFVLVKSLSWDVSIYLIYFVNEDFFASCRVHSRPILNLAIKHCYLLRKLYKALIWCK